MALEKITTVVTLTSRPVYAWSRLLSAFAPLASFILLPCFGFSACRASAPVKSSAQGRSNGSASSPAQEGAQVNEFAIVGRVVNSAGKGIARAHVVAYAEPYDYNSVAGAKSGMDGGFRIDGLRGGTYTLRVETTFVERELGLAADRFTGIRAGTSTCELVLPGAAAITGRVLSPDGKPVFNCYVYCSERDIEDWPDAADRTDQEGGFRLDVREGSLVDVVAIPERPAAPLDPTRRYHARLNRVPAGTEGIEIRVQPK